MVVRILLILILSTFSVFLQAVELHYAAIKYTKPLLHVEGNEASGEFTLGWERKWNQITTLQESIDNTNFIDLYSGPDNRFTMAKYTGQEFFYRIKICNLNKRGTDGLCTIYSDVKKVKVEAFPSIPSFNGADHEDLDGSFTISWTGTSPNTDSFKLYRRKDFGKWIEINNAITEYQYEFRNLSQGIYDFYLQACNEQGCSRESNIKTVSVYDAEYLVNGFNVFPSYNDGNYTLTYQPNPVSNNVKFEIAESIGSNASLVTLTLEEDGDKSFFNRPEGVYHYYSRTCTQVLDGTSEGDLNAISCTNYSPVQIVRVIKSRPAITTLAIDNNSSTNGTAELSWSGNSETEFYEVYELEPNSEWKLIDSTSALTYSIEKSKYGLYQYKIRSCNRGGCSAFTNSIEFDFFPIPNAIHPVISSDVQNGFMQLNWHSDIHEAIYEVEMRGGLHCSQQDWCKVYEGSNNSYSAHLSDGTYSVKIRACKFEHCSKFSTPLSFLVVTPPSIPTLNGSHESNSGNITIDFETSYNTDSLILLKNVENTGVSTQIELKEFQEFSDRIPENGQVSFRAKACNQRYCTPYSEEHVVEVNLTLEGLVPDSQVVSLEIPSNEVVGTIAGNSSVSGSAVRYNIPIDVPPGRNEMSPRISLDYASNRKGDLLALGWSLGYGSSSIKRCNFIPAVHGFGGKYNGSKSDPLCLNGNYLVLESGLQGHNGSIYRLERNNFTKVELVNDLDSNDSYFIVTDSDGNISTLSFGSDFGGEYTISWDITKKADTFGNTINYSYFSSIHEPKIERITYTGYDNDEGDRSIEFKYSDTSELNFKHLKNGGQKKSSSRLSSIETYYQSNLVSLYKLNTIRSQNSSKTLLSSVERCSNYSCSSRLRPIEFEYHSPSSSMVDYELTSTLNNSSTTYTPDLDGDGIRDYILTENQLTPSGSVEVVNRKVILSSNHVVNITESFINNEEFINVYGALTKQKLDFNLDGYNELIGNASGKKVFGTWNGNEFDSHESNLLDSLILVSLNDFNLDGKIDVVRKGENTNNLTLTYNCTEIGSDVYEFCSEFEFPSFNNELQSAKFEDINGDGILDFILVDKADDDENIYLGKLVKLSNGQFYSLESARSLSSLGGPRNRKNALFIDVNSDGHKDIFLHVNQTEIWINSGKSALLENEQLFYKATISQGLQDIGYNRSARHAISIDLDNDKDIELLIGSQFIDPYCLQIPIADPGSVDAGHIFEVDCTNETGWERGIASLNKDKSIFKFDKIEFKFQQNGSITFETEPTNYYLPLTGASACKFGQFERDLICIDTNPTYGVNSVGTIVPLDHWVNSEQPFAQTENRGNWVAKPEFNNSDFGVDKLKSVLNGFGFEEQWFYTPLSSEGISECNQLPFYLVDYSANKPGHYHFSTSEIVVAKSMKSNGNGGMNTTCFYYEDAMFSSGGRGFQGFKTIVESSNQGDGLDKSVKTEFHDEFPLTGLVKSVTTFSNVDINNAHPISITTNDFFFVVDHLASGKTYRTLNRENITTKFDLISGLTKGKKIEKYDYAPTDVDFSNPSTKTMISETYNSHGSLIKRAKIEESFLYDYSRYESLNWKNKREQVLTSVYPNEYFGDLSIIDTPQSPLKTKVVDFVWFDDERRVLDSMVVQKGIADQELTESYRYDLYGNILSKRLIDENNDVRLTEKNYEATGYFPNIELDAKRNEYRKIYEPKFGNLLYEKTPKGIEKDYTYNEYGQLLFEDSSLFPTKSIVRNYCNTECVVNSSYSVTEVQDGTPTSTSFFDELDRVVLSQVRDREGKGVISTVTQYDDRGNLIAESMPSSLTEPEFYTRYLDFDALGRYSTKIVDRGDHTHNQQVWHYHYDGIDTNITLPDGISSAKRQYDIDKNLLSTQDSDGAIISYRYDAQGNKILISDIEGNTIVNEFDELGRIVTSSDPDTGFSRVSYNGFSDIRAYENANREITSYEYDVLGRKVKLYINGELESRWIYDTHKPLTLTQVSKVDGSFLEQYYYDEFGINPIKIERIIDGNQIFDSKYVYDSYYGRLKGRSAASGEMIAFKFDKFGYQISEYDPVSLLEYFRINDTNDYGKVTDATYGNGMKYIAEYHLSSGYTKLIDHVSPEGVSLIKSQYFYEDEFGNVTQRSRDLNLEHIHGRVSQSISYDNVQRVKSSHVQHISGDVESFDYNYDLLGNLTVKSDFSNDYIYGSSARSQGNAGPHAVARLRGLNGTIHEFVYDDSGNMLSGLGRSVEYNAFSKPIRIREGATETNLYYTPDFDVYKREENSRTIYYGNDGYQKVVQNEKDYERTSLTNNVQVSYDNGVRSTKYFHFDRLNSLILITGDSGQELESFGYDIFGKPLTVSWENTNESLGLDGILNNQSSEVGYTGHEHLDNHRLIHMIGRVYDPILGRFLSVDPKIQSEISTQSLNGYSYVMNNPLSMIDPSGYEGECIEGNGVCNPNIGEEPGATGGNDVSETSSLLKFGNTDLFFVKQGPDGVDFGLLNVSDETQLSETSKFTLSLRVLGGKAEANSADVAGISASAAQVKGEFEYGDDNAKSKVAGTLDVLGGGASVTGGASAYGVKVGAETTHDVNGIAHTTGADVSIGVGVSVSYTHKIGNGETQRSEQIFQGGALDAYGPPVYLDPQAIRGMNRLINTLIGNHPIPSQEAVREVFRAGHAQDDQHFLDSHKRDTRYSSKAYEN